MARYEDRSAQTMAPPGRPRLGVIAREVTLLPRHWDWLNGQPGGASVALRRLVDEARHATPVAEKLRQAREATYGFLTAEPATCRATKSRYDPCSPETALGSTP